jgi:hypothetical protein
MWTHRASLAVAAVLTLCCAVARSDDGRKAPSEDPDPGFLEFLGSVDRLADVNPDYLSQPAPSGTSPAPQGATSPAPAPPPPPPRQPLPPSASAASGGQKNE